jgi:hypothetical protein
VLSAEASSGLPVNFAIVTSAVCKFEGGPDVAFVGAGTCTIQANQAGNGYFEAASQVEQSFEVAKALQHISFAPFPPSTVVLGEGPFPVAATSSSALPVKLSSATASICSLEGGEVHPLAAGTCTIDANQSGDGYYEEAQTKDSFTITKRSQVVRFTSNAPASASAGGATYMPTAEASSGLPVSFSAGPAGVCQANGGTIDFIGAGTCVIETVQAGDAEFAPAAVARQSINVLPAPIIPGSPSSPLPPLSAPFGSTASSSFRLLDAAAVNGTSGAITFFVSVAQAGTVSWKLTFAGTSFGATTARRSKCRPGQVRLGGACRPRRLTFGAGTLAVDSSAAASGKVSFTVVPSRAAKSALQAARRLRRGLAVSASITFQSSLGGSSVTHRYSVTDRLRSTRRNRTS